MSAPRALLPPLVLACLALPAEALSQQRLRPAPAVRVARPRPVGPTSGTAQLGDPVIFNNSAPSELFYDISDGAVVFDEGRIPSTTAPELGALDSYSINELEIAYVTRALDPSGGGPGARIVLTLYASADPCVPPAQLPALIARLNLVGLPASTVAGTESTHIVSVVPPSPICFRADGDGTYSVGGGNGFV